MRSSWTRSRTLLAGGLLSALAATAPAAAAPGAAPQPRPQLDVRQADRASVPQRTREARDVFERRAGDPSAVDVDPTAGGVRALGLTDGALTSAARGDAADIALAYVRDHAVVLGIDGDDIASLRLAARYTSPNGVTHLTWQQTSRGLPAFDSLLTVNVAADGRIVNLTGRLAGDLDAGTAVPSLTAASALAAAQRDVGAAVSVTAAREQSGAERRTRFAGGDTARLVVFADADGDRLAWRLTVAGEDPYVYDVAIDAETGKLLARHSLTELASNASVYDQHPGAAAGGVAHNVDLASDPQWMNRSNLTSPARLDGRNAHAYADVGGINGFDAGEDIGPSGGSDWLYPQVGVACAAGSPSVFTLLCTWSGTTATRAGEEINRKQTATQLFYFVNTFHDWLAAAPIGFTDASHNFEVGGTGGSDQVNAEADDSTGFNNANMFTPTDGSSPRMQMYLFSNPVVNSGDDASIVYHEYTHGLSNRLVNNGLGGGLFARQSRAMGEGWSDFFAMDYLVAQGLMPDTASDGEAALAEYSTNDVDTGIRRNAIDCSVGSTAAAACPGSADPVGSGGFTFADMGQIGAYASVGADRYSRFQVHDEGELWGQTLWDLRKALGAVVTRGLVAEAMRLSPPNPSFLDERDAILQADVVTGGTRHAQIWAVFAARGMGYSAKVSGSEATRASEAFDLPPTSIATATAPTVTDPPPLGDGDSRPESGETARLRIRLRNPAAATLTNVRATLTTTTPGVTVGQPTVAYPDIGARATDGGDIPFAITLPTTLPCATVLGLSLTVRADQGEAVLPLTLDLGTRPGATHAATGLPLTIPDNARPGPTATVGVPTAGPVDRLRVGITVAHNFVGNLAGRLTAPDGTSIELFERPGGGSTGAGVAGFDRVVFDDDAPTSIQDLPPFNGLGLPAISGAYRPNEPLSKFSGRSRTGAWTLRVFDAAAPNAGSLTAVSIQTVDGPPACATTAPAPAEVAIAPATAVAPTSATINGFADPKDAATETLFQWGTTSAYGRLASAGFAEAGSGSTARSANLTGLELGTTYHYRLVARRAGTVIALSPDASFTAAAPEFPVPAPPEAAAVQPPPVVEPPARSAPKPSVTGMPAHVRLTGKGHYTLTFSARPLRAAGSIVVAGAAGRGAALKLGTKAFTVPASGRVKLVFKPSANARKAVRRLRRVRVRAKITLAGATFTKTLTLRAPKTG